MQASSSPPSGYYPIDSTHAAELERLNAQDQAWAKHMSVLLDRIGVAEGWRCIDLGCGPRGATHDLSERVGETGKVIGLEFNPNFVSAARSNAPFNVEILEGDAYSTGLPDASFDLVHMRFLASTSGEPDRLIAEAIRLIKPGGWFAMQEADATTLACYPPHPAWKRLRDGMVSLFPEAQGDDPAAHRHYRMLRANGLENVGYQPSIIGVRADDPWRDYLPSTVNSARNAIIGTGVMSEDELDNLIAECRSHLADPDTVFVSPMLVQVWGRKPI